MQAPQIHPKDHMLQNYAELIYVDDIADLTLGDIQIYRLHPFAKYAAAKTIPKKSINYQERINFKHPSVFSNIRIQQVSSQYKIFFEYDFMSLSNVLQKRLENKQLFPEHEIWQIINQLSSAMQFLQSKNVSHGNLSAQSIFFDDEYQIFRIYDNSLLNGEMQGFYNFTLNGKIKNNNSTLKTRDQTDKTSNNASSDSNNCTMEILVAPELLKMFTNQEKPLNPNLFKSDVFSFGMLVLQMGTLLPIMECYNRETISFNYQKLSQHIHTFAQRYSPHLLNFVQQLLELDVSKRLDWNELVKITHDGYYAGIMKASQILLFQCIKQTEEDKKKHLQDQLKQLSHVIKSEKPMIIQQADNTIKTDSAPEQCFNPQQQQISPELPQQQLQQQQQQQQLQQGQQQQKVKVESTSNIDAKKIQQIQQQQQQQVQQDQQNQHVQQVQVKQVQVNLEQPQRKISKQLIQNQNLENALNKTYDLISQLKFEQDKQQVIQNQNEQQNQTLNATQIQGQTSQELKASALIQNRFLSKVTSQRQLGDSSLIINKLGVNNRVGEQKQFTDRDQGNQAKISQYFFEGMSKTIRQQIISKQNDPQNFNKQKMSNKQEFVSKSQFFDKASSKIAEGYQNVQENQGDLLSVRNSNIQVLNQIKDNNTSQIIADNVSTNRNKNSNSVQTLVASKRHNFSIAYQQGLMNASMYIEKVTKESPRLSKFDTSMNQHASNIQNKENNNNLVRQHNKSANQKEEKVVKKRDMNEALKVLNERITLTLKQSNDRTKNLRQILKKIQQN